MKRRGSKKSSLLLLALLEARGQPAPPSARPLTPSPALQGILWSLCLFCSCSAASAYYLRETVRPAARPAERA